MSVRIGSMPPEIISDQLARLRPLDLGDVDEWMAGEDDEQIRWFEFPGSATRHNVVDAIRKWVHSWRTRGPVRHWAVCEPTTDHILGGVKARDLGGGEVNRSGSRGEGDGCSDCDHQGSGGQSGFVERRTSTRSRGEPKGAVGWRWRLHRSPARPRG